MKIAAPRGVGPGSKLSAPPSSRQHCPVQVARGPPAAGRVERIGRRRVPTALNLAGTRADAIFGRLLAAPDDEKRALLEGAGASPLRLREELTQRANFRQMLMLPTSSRLRRQRQACPIRQCI